MRVAVARVLLAGAALAVGVAALAGMAGVAGLPLHAQKAAVPSATATPSTQHVTPAAIPSPTSAAITPVRPCTNPNALGVARVVEIDTTGGPGFGFEHFKMHNFLRTNEVVLTFDDGPWPNTTRTVLAALAAQCVKATFFAVGRHALWSPDVLKDVADAGHTIGTHTWSHANLAKKSAAEARDEVEKGISAVRAALGAPPAPFFRFPTLSHPAEVVAYLGERNIATFSTDMDSFDFKMRKPEQVVQSVLAKLQKHGKGIVLMHDLQRVTAEALPDLLKALKAGGYKIVHIKAKEPVSTVAAYDAAIAKEHKIPTLSGRPTASVVRTISGE